MTSESVTTAQSSDAADMGDDVLNVVGLKKYFPVTRGFIRRHTSMVRAVDGLTFSIKSGETLGIVGESGCGKTTASRCIVRSLKPTEGQIWFRTGTGDVVDLSNLSQSQMRPFRRDIQFIFQDPYTSLNPRMTIFEIVAEPLVVNNVGNRREQEDRVSSLLRRVGLAPEYMKRYPHAFSGGQRQRIGIARALALNPRLIVADEPVSALDVSVQAQVLNLMADLQNDLGLAYVFVAHDLRVVRHICHRVVVMYVGKVAEIGNPDDLFRDPKHPYTEALISSLPAVEPSKRKLGTISLSGEVPNPADPPSGCFFHPRCPYAVEKCRVEAPEVREIEPGRFTSCHRIEELELVGSGD